MELYFPGKEYRFKMIIFQFLKAQKYFLIFLFFFSPSNLRPSRAFLWGSQISKLAFDIDKTGMTSSILWREKK